MPERVTILKRPTAATPDEYGNVAEGDWPTDGETWPARVQQGASNEDRNRRESTQYGLNALLPPNVDIDDGDRLMWQDRVYLVDGVKKIQHPFDGNTHHIRAGMVRET